MADLVWVYEHHRVIGSLRQVLHRIGRCAVILCIDPTLHSWMDSVLTEGVQEIKFSGAERNSLKINRLLHDCIDLSLLYANVNVWRTLETDNGRPNHVCSRAQGIEVIGSTKQHGKVLYAMCTASPSVSRVKVTAKFDTVKVQKTRPSKFLILCVDAVVTPFSVLNPGCGPSPLQQAYCRTIHREPLFCSSSHSNTCLYQIRLSMDNVLRLLLFELRFGSKQWVCG